MPRERIKRGSLFITEAGSSLSTAHIPGENMPDGGAIHEEPSLEISWSRDGQCVQVAFVAPLAWLDAAQRDLAPNESHVSLYTEALSRAEINHMIRTLRRARDAAYGSDE